MADTVTRSASALSSRRSSRPSTGGSTSSCGSRKMESDAMSMDRSVVDSLKLVAVMRREQLRHVQYMKHNEVTSLDQQEYAKSRFEKTVEITTASSPPSQSPTIVPCSKTMLSAYLTMNREMGQSSEEPPSKDPPSYPTRLGSSLYNPRSKLLNQIRMRQQKKPVMFYHDRIEQEVIQEGGGIPTKTLSHPFKWSDSYIYSPYPNPKVNEMAEQYALLRDIEMATRLSTVDSVSTRVEFEELDDEALPEVEEPDDEELAEIEKIPFHPPLDQQGLMKPPGGFGDVSRRGSRSSRKNSRRGSRLSDSSRRGSRRGKRAMTVSSVGSDDKRRVSRELHQLADMVKIVKLDTERQRKAAEEEYLRLHPPPPPPPEAEPVPEPLPEPVQEEPTTGRRGRAAGARSRSGSKSPKPSGAKSPKPTKAKSPKPPAKAKSPRGGSASKRGASAKKGRGKKVATPPPEPVAEEVAVVEEVAEPEPCLADIWPVFEGPVLPQLPDFVCPSSPEKSKVYMTKNWWKDSPLLRKPGLL